MPDPDRWLESSSSSDSVSSSSDSALAAFARVFFFGLALEELVADLAATAAFLDVLLFRGDARVQTRVPARLPWGS